MSEDSLENIVSKLRCMENFSSLVNKYNECRTSSFMFEILFANTFENYGMSLECEVGISPLNNSTVDFTYTETDNKKLCFELVSPEMSDELKRQCTPRKTEIDGILEWEVPIATIPSWILSYQGVEQLFMPYFLIFQKRFFIKQNICAKRGEYITC